MPAQSPDHLWLAVSDDGGYVHLLSALDGREAWQVCNGVQRYVTVCDGDVRLLGALDAGARRGRSDHHAAAVRRPPPSPGGFSGKRKGGSGAPRLSPVGGRDAPVARVAGAPLSRGLEWGRGAEKDRSGLLRFSRAAVGVTAICGRFQ